MKVLEHKPWRWRRNAPDKTIVANGRTSLSLEKIAQEDEETELGSSRCPSNLSERLASVICDCSAKDELIRKHAMMAEEALAGQERAEAEVSYLKKELEKTVMQGEAAERRLAHLDAALKECMREIESLRREQDERMQNAFTKVIEDFEKAKKKLEERLSESNKRVSNLTAENANLMKALLCKEKLIEDLDKGKAQLEAEFDMLMARSDTTEKENTFLKYECGVMEKELDLRNEERVHSQRLALKTTKHIRKLEAECQQLKNLVRKRLQSPAADQASMRRKSLNPTLSKIAEKPSNGTSFLIERVYDLEEENKTLREILAFSDCEIHSWRKKYGQMASRLADFETQLKELTEGENSMQLALADISAGNDEENGDSESWANALLAELEQFKRGNYKNQAQALEMGELDGNQNFAIVPSSAPADVANQQLQLSSKKSWLDEILKVILEEHRVSKRSLGELLLDIKLVLGCKDDYSKDEANSSKQKLAGLLAWKSEEEGQSFEDASFTREKIRKHSGFDRSKSDNQIDIDASSRHNTLSQLIKIQSTLQEENRGIEKKLHIVTEENELLRNHIDNLNATVECLRIEADALRDSKGIIEDQIENQRLINEDLDTQLTVAKAKLNEVLHKVSSLEIELEDKSNCCDELEGTCLELQLQLETISRKESPNMHINQVAKTFSTETIQQLEKQLKALTSPDRTFFNRVLSPTTIILPQRCSLRDCMLEDNGSKEEVPKLPKAKQEVAELKALPAPEHMARSPEQLDALAIVPYKKPASGGFGFFRKMFVRRKGVTINTNTIPLQRNTSTLIRRRDAALL